MDDKYPIENPLDKMSTDAMWAGSIEAVEGKHLLIDCNDNLKFNTFNHSPALMKSIDEILMNAVDQCMRTDSIYKANKISVYLDGLTFRIINNGDGIPVSLHRKACEILNRKDVYIPEVIFSFPFCGSSTIDREAGNNIKAGINCLGGKIANVHSTYFRIETQDAKEKIFYSIIFDGCKRPRTPVVQHCPEMKANEAYTSIEFTPNYLRMVPSNVKYLAGSQLYVQHESMKAYVAELEDWLRYRLMLIAIYTGLSVDIILNDMLITSKSTRLFAERVNKNNKYVSTIVSSTSCKYKWDLTIVIFKKINNVPKTHLNSKHLSIVNGVYTPKGAHISYISQEVDIHLKRILKFITGTEDDTEIEKVYLSHYRIILSMSLPNADWVSQSKDTLSNNPLIKTYKIDEKFLVEVAETLVGEYIDRKDNKKLKITNSAKYIPAKYQGGIYGHLCTLVVM